MTTQPEVGQRLGDFEIVRELGRGGMGVVYEARQVSLNRTVALKVLAAGVGASPRAVQRFRREAEAAGRLHHSHIVPVHAVGEQDGTHFYAMEFVRGESLDRVLDRRRQADGRETPPPEQVPTEPYVPGGTSAPPLASPSILPGSGPAYFDAVAALVADAADALDHAHRMGVVHRDVKPSNLLLAADGRVQVTDFGLARVAEEAAVTLPGEFVGTPAYMSPEQIAAGRVAVDHRTDVYSLGATLYELLTLRPPFAGPGRDQLLAQVLQKEPAAPRSVHPAVPRDLETVCLKCLEKDPDRRYATAKELADDLRRYLGRFAIRAKRPGPVAKLRKWVVRNPALSAAALVALLMAAVAGYVGWQAYRSHRHYVAERQRAAIDKGMVAALAADLVAAREAIAEAEALGTSAGELHLLRGFIALYAGDGPTALQECQAAVDRMPESVAARALLAASIGRTTSNDDAEPVLKAAEQLPLRTPEDRLFLGLALSPYDAAAGLRHLRAAVAERSSNLGKVILAEALWIHAADTGLIADAEEALDAAETARRLLPNNSYVEVIATWARLVAAVAYDLAGDRNKGKAHLDQACRQADTLSGPPESSDVVTVRLWVATYHDGVNPPLPLTARLRIPEESANPEVVGNAAVVRWRLGQVEQARTLAAPLKPTFYTSQLKVALALEQPDGRAAARAAWAAAVEPDHKPVVLLTMISWLYLTGEAKTVPVMAAKLRASGFRWRPVPPAEWDRMLRFYEGQLSETEYLNAPAARRTIKFSRHSLVGMKRLGEGDREGARKAFVDAVETRTFWTAEWEWLHTFLIRMNTDPEWPRAIPVKPKP